MEWFWAIYAVALVANLWFGIRLFFDLWKSRRARKNREHKHFWRLYHPGTDGLNMEFRCEPRAKCPGRYFLIIDRELYKQKVSHTL